jgi:antitoxin (DNA-binding transcriptional repressor) of toxin-antitoxin stability system
VRVVDILEAQEKLEELIDELAPGESFAIAVNGKPRVKVVKLKEEEIEELLREGS